MDIITLKSTISRQLLLHLKFEILLEIIASHLCNQQACSVTSDLSSTALGLIRMIRHHHKNPPKEGSATLDCACDASEPAVAGVFKDSEKELALPEDDAGVLVVPKPVNPEVGADALVPDAGVLVVPKPVNPEVGADALVPNAGTVNAGNVKPELAEDTLGAAELVAVVVVTVEKRDVEAEELRNVKAEELERDGAEANEKPGEEDTDVVADAEEAVLVVLFKNEKPEEVVLEAVLNENAGAGVAGDEGIESPGAAETEAEALGNENPGADAAELEMENAEVEATELRNENPETGEAELEEVVDGATPNGEAEDDPNEVEEPKRLEVDPEFAPNKDGGLPPVEAGVEDPNKPVGAELTPNCGAAVAVAVAVEVDGADVDEPNSPEFSARPDPNAGALEAVVDPKGLGVALAPDPKREPVLPAEEEVLPNRLGVGAPDPKRLDPGAGDPNGDVEGVGVDGAGVGVEVGVDEPNALAVWPVPADENPKTPELGADPKMLEPVATEEEDEPKSEEPPNRDEPDDAAPDPKPNEGAEEAELGLEAKPKEGVEEEVVAVPKPNEAPEAAPKAGDVVPKAGAEEEENENPVPAIAVDVKPTQIWRRRVLAKGEIRVLKFGEN
ncbi:hypothetical protein SASPL_103895 [Salvia splendens]|uniref:Uncharacterized protein n=1 Tax=Salvia splendens TaxID=180675 RepID=A0A8X8YLS4_SALSN|nr:hypothetical protein SASPL_103895 [Salvia splendens]